MKSERNDGVTRKLKLKPRTELLAMNSWYHHRRGAGFGRGGDDDGGAPGVGEEPFSFLVLRRFFVPSLFSYFHCFSREIRRIYDFPRFRRGRIITLMY